MKASTSTISYFKNLDALRFFAFMGVFLSHTIVVTIENSFLDKLVTALTLDYLSVPFFFSLSSFLITYNLLKEKKETGKVVLLHFYKNRALRIWPLYFTLIIIGFIIIPTACKLIGIDTPTLPTLMPFLLFFVNYHIIENGLYFTFILMILWSISIEEQFYLFWGALLKWMKRTWIIQSILIILLISITYSYYNLSQPFLVIDTIFVLQNFCFGALTAWIVVERNNWVLKIIQAPRYIFLLPYFLLPIIYIYIDNVLIENILKSICYASILFDQTVNINRLINFGRSTFLNYLGKISYGLYIYHALIIEIVSKKFNFFDHNNQSVLINILHISITLIITTIVAHFSFILIEQKFLSLKTKRSLSH
jgi:peptidoglycan/LPS O-acetylase OafA/YrhL